MNPHLFVYGSLMSSAGHPMGERLRREARLLGPAAIRGCLYRISWYPGAVAEDQGASSVHGEVYALDDPARALAWLDEYEGIRPGSANAAEYVRLERQALLASGEEVTAWVYLYCGKTQGLEQIADGRYKPAQR